MTRHVLVIDDDPVQRRLIEANVTRMGHIPVLRDSGAGGLEALRQDADRRIAAVVLDLVMPVTGGLEVLAEMRRLGHLVPVVVQTARSGIDTVVEAMRAGAFDFVVKPASPDKLQQVIARAIRMHDSQSRKTRPAVPVAAEGLAARTGAAMQPVLALAERAAASTIPLLIEGETGVGKEWLAEAIRAAGPRAKAPLVVVNCGALPSQLVESILFGHEKGAFTDATERHAGKFLDADGGTLFLDEIGELPIDVQVKLLRVLQSGEIDPVGGRRTVRTDVRIIAATNRNLSDDAAAGRFREDLYYRLNVLPIRVPPLRQRRDEIDHLAGQFLLRFAAAEPASPARGFTAAALSLLRRYDWPGNIRQLENAIHRAVVLADRPILGIEDFPQIAAFVPGERIIFAGEAEAQAHPVPAVPEAIEWLPANTSRMLPAFDADGELRTADAVEADLLRLAVEHYDGRMSEIARRLGIGRSTLYRKMRVYGIAVAEAG